MQDNNDLGATLAMERKRKGLSQRRLAELSGVSNTTIASLERGKGARGTKPVKPTPDTLKLLARGLATDLVSSRPDGQEMFGFYTQLMKAAGYAWLLYDQRQMIDIEATPPSEREGLLFADLSLSDEAQSLAESLSWAIQNGAVGGSQLRAIRDILKVLNRMADPDYKFHEKPEAESDD